MLFESDSVRLDYFITFSQELVKTLTDNDFYYLYKDTTRNIEYFVYEKTEELNEIVKRNSKYPVINLGGFQI